MRASDVVATAVLAQIAGLVPSLAHAHDEMVIRERMRLALGYDPDLKNPQTYNEKIAWRILRDTNPLIALTTDKVSARDYVAAKLSPDVLIPVVGIFDRVSDILWDELPDSFVLKAAHGCAMNIIVRDKATADRNVVLRTGRQWLKRNYYDSSREWAYRGIKPRLIVEHLLLDRDGNIPPDFKFLVFHGRTQLIRVHLDRFGDHRVNFYDPQLQLLSLRQVFPSDPSYTPPPEVASLAVLAEKLAADFDYARIDMYLVDGKAWFGEITHHDGNAGIFFEPPEFDATLGALWELPLTGR